MAVETVEFGKVVRNLDSKRVPLSSRERAERKGSFPYYGAAGIIDYVNAPIFKGLHLLIGEDGSVVREDGTPYLQLADGEFWVNNHAHVVRADRDIDTRYIYYALQKANIASLVTGAVQPKLTQGNLNKFRIPYPEEATRDQIVGILGTLDDKIELNRRMAATLEEMARAIFKSWFIDFDPVRARAEGSPTILPSEINALFPDSLNEDDLPCGWELRPLDSLGKFLNGLALQKYPPVTVETLPVIKIAQLRKMSTADADRCGDNLPNDYVVEDGDILFSWSGSLESVVWTGGQGGLNQHLFKVTSDEVPDWFLYFAIQEHLPWFRGIAASKATTMGHIQRTHLSEAKIAYCADVVAGADDILAPMYQRMWKLKLESRTLAATRDALLPKLIAGQIRTVIQEEND